MRALVSPTIYTHSIAWALHGKAWCKLNAQDALKKTLGDKIEALVRKGQDGQSLGIPLGPDTSIVIAEIIGAAIDQELEAELLISQETAFRYTDDFFLGLRDGRTSERTIARLSAALSTYELELNSEKTRVVTPATRAEPDWALDISQFRLPADEAKKPCRTELPV